MTDSIFGEPADLQSRGTRRPPVREAELETPSRVRDLANVKRLPAEFLQSLGLEDVSRGIQIPYFGIDGELAPRQRIRVSPARQKNKSIWDSGEGAIVPYGLNRLREAFDAGFLVLTEGESDCWTLWYKGFPALGIPGASMANCLLPQHLTEVEKLYIIQEPDRGGETFVKGITTKLRDPRFNWKGEAFVVSLGVKDPSEMYVQDPNAFSINFQRALDSALPTHLAEPDGWREMFHSFSDFENAAPLSFAIDGFLQNNGATMIGGLSGHGKTLILQSITKALLTGKGTRLWGLFEVLESAVRVVYLIPECAIQPFKHRLRLFGLYDYLAPNDNRLLVRTLSKGPAPSLSDPRILFAVKGAHVVLDTAARFGEGDENSASDNQRGLATDIFALLGAGARSVIAAHHSPKPFAKENVMRLENVLRGSGDVGAMLTTAWGVKQLDAAQNIIHIENIKPRDFQPCAPFEIIGRPAIDQTGDFRLHKAPGACGSLMEEQEPERDKGGAPPESRLERTRRIDLMKEWLAEDSSQTTEQLRARFERAGIKVGSTAVKNYRREAQDE